MDRILAIGAHPDDVESGAAGMLQRGTAKRIVVLTRGCRGGNGNEREAEAMEASLLLGASLSIHALRDTALDLPAVVSVLENEIRTYDPDVVLTMSSHDTHQDHRTVHEATLIATRDLCGTVLAYCTPSSAERFRPNWYVTLSEAEMLRKLEAIACHKSQLQRPYMRAEYAQAVARHWAQVTRSREQYVEPYECVRVKC